MTTHIRRLAKLDGTTTERVTTRERLAIVDPDTPDPIITGGLDGTTTEQDQTDQQTQETRP